MAIQEREADLVIATFGRALWVLDDIRPLRKIASNKAMAITSPVTVFPAPEAYQAQYRAATGYEWSTYGLYDGENRRRGAPVTFYINRPKTAGQPTTAQTETQPVAQPTGGVGRGVVAARAVDSDKVACEEVTAPWLEFIMIKMN